MQFSVTKSAKPSQQLIALIVDGGYMILADGHHSGQLHNIYSEFAVCVGGQDTLEGTLLKFGTDRLQPVYLGDTITIQTGA